jgi:hypothetical protein
MGEKGVSLQYTSGAKFINAHELYKDSTGQNTLYQDKILRDVADNILLVSTKYRDLDTFRVGLSTDHLSAVILAGSAMINTRSVVNSIEEYSHDVHFIWRRWVTELSDLVNA